MKQVEERYISLLTDFGFKRIFGTAMNKDLLICFLNSLFNGRQVVKVEIRNVLHNLFAIKQTVEKTNQQILVYCCSKNSLEAEVG